MAQEAVTTHHLFASGAAPVDVQMGATAPAQIAIWASQELGYAVQPPDLSAAGYRLSGARLVPTGGGLGCVFLYDGTTGNRLTVFVRRMRDATMSSPMREVRDAPGYVWVMDGVGVSLISNQAMTGLHALANTVRSNMHL